MRVVFLGNCADYSLPFLEALAARDDVQLVSVVSPQRSALRRHASSFTLRPQLGGVIDPLPGARRVSRRHGQWSKLARLATTTGATVSWPQSVSTPELCAQLTAARPDLAIVAGLTQILRGPILDAFPIVNFHPSLLPSYRGGVPEFWQLAAGEREGGVTAHLIEHGVDTGPILMQARIPIEPWLDADDLTARCASAGAALLGRLLDAFPASITACTPQVGGSYQPLPAARDREVPWEHAAKVVFDRARAVGFREPLSFYVERAAWLAGEVTRALAPAERGEQPLELLAFDPLAFEQHFGDPVGRVLRWDQGAVVSCNPGAVLFRRIEPASPPDEHR